MRAEEWAGFGAVPVVIALVEAVKRAFPGMPRRWLPLLAIALAEAWAVVVALMLGQPVGEAAVTGVLVGLTAVGLFSAGRATMGG